MCIYVLENSPMRIRLIVLFYKPDSYMNYDTLLGMTHGQWLHFYLPPHHVCGSASTFSQTTQEKEDLSFCCSGTKKYILK